MAVLIAAAASAVGENFFANSSCINSVSNEYLPPVGEATQEIAIEAPAQESAVLADDGYRYKTVRRVIRRRRRDVNELSNEYLPPVGEATQEIAIEAPAQESAVLADDGYRYKTVRRVIRRRRRDVNELSNEYLPPVGEATQEIAIEAPAQESAVLADDGYRYKTVRRVIRRRRRDVNELSSEYLPPVEQAVIDVPAEQTVVADDGYRYKTVRRLKYRRH
ncbi:GH15700 [Drosophila grimshawi]|uniref:GH15700 n=1 Tax=Drosophila grimshawi TaxID=7222 RepID=B4IZ58_DROGR|nr:GH15700 [Drosophila grimshawi]